MMTRPGTWVCPCGTANFTTWEECEVCATPKDRRPASDQWACPTCGEPNHETALSCVRCLTVRVPSTLSAPHSRDWRCPCSVLNTYPRLSCRTCGWTQRLAPVGVVVPRDDLWVCACGEPNSVAIVWCAKCASAPPKKRAEKVAPLLYSSDYWGCGSCGARNIENVCQSCYRPWKYVIGAGVIPLADTALVVATWSLEERARRRVVGDALQFFRILDDTTLRYRVDAYCFQGVPASWLCDDTLAEEFLMYSFGTLAVLIRRARVGQCEVQAVAVAMPSGRASLRSPLDIHSQQHPSVVTSGVLRARFHHLGLRGSVMVASAHVPSHPSTSHVIPTMFWKAVDPLGWAYFVVGGAAGIEAFAATCPTSITAPLRSTTAHILSSGTAALCSLRCDAWSSEAPMILARVLW